MTIDKIGSGNDEKNVLIALVTTLIVGISTVNINAEIGDWKLNVSTPLEKTTDGWSYDVGNYNSDGIPDIYCIKKL